MCLTVAKKVRARLRRAHGHLFSHDLIKFVFCSLHLSRLDSQPRPVGGLVTFPPTTNTFQAAGRHAASDAGRPGGRAAGSRWAVAASRQMASGLQVASWAAGLVGPTCFLLLFGMLRKRQEIH